jgi:hypothetical protein
MTGARFFIFALLCLATNACQLLGGLQVETVNVHTEKPSNVAAYVSVRKSGVPVEDLQIDQFKVAEDGQVLDSKQVGLQLLDRNLAAAHHVLVLVDLSGPIDQSGALSLLATQMAAFVERLRAKHSVSVWAFDGSDDLTALGKFQRSGASSKPQTITKQDLGRLTAFTQKDSSSNLNGAVMHALTELGKELGNTGKPISIGTLVIVARGPDLAGRTAEGAMADAITDSPYQVFAVTVGDEKDTRLPELLGPAGNSQVKYFENLEVGLSEVARQIESDYERYYLLSYCSPARAGERTLVVSVTTHDGDGDAVTGDVDIPIDAKGFGSGCNAGAPPFLERGHGAPSAAPSESNTPSTSAETKDPATEAEPSAVPPPGDGYAH